MIVVSRLGRTGVTLSMVPCHVTDTRSRARLCDHVTPLITSVTVLFVCLFVCNITVLIVHHA